MMPRAAIKEFQVGNPAYKGSTVTFYTVAAGVKTATKATLYSSSTGTTQLANPQKLDSYGKFKRPAYIDVPVIGTIEGITVPTHDTGIISPAPTFRVSSAGALQYSFDGGVVWNETGDYFFRDRGDWVAVTDYQRNDIARVAGAPYVALSDNVSTASFAADLAAGNWRLLFSLSAADISFLQAGVGAATQTMQEKARQSVSAADNGSKMTTTPGADINAAITYLSGVGGGTVLIPAGSFSIETTILQKSNVYIKGSGIGATKLNAKTGLNGNVIKNATAVVSQSLTGITRTLRTATATKIAHGYATGAWIFISGCVQQEYNGAHQIFNVTANTFDFFVEKAAATPATTAASILAHGVTDSKLTLSDLEIVGNAANTVGDNYGVGYSGVENFSISNVYAHDTYHTCIVIISGVNGSLVNVRGDGAIHAQHNGFVIGSSNGGPSAGPSHVQNIMLANCSATLNSQDGFIFQTGRGVTVTNSVARRNGLSGFKPCQVSQIVINGCYAEDNIGHGIQLQGASGISDVVLSNNICRQNGESGMFLSNLDTTATMSQLSVTGNICDRNGQIAASTQYGIAFENALLATIDQILLANNICTNQGRGISFSANGTNSNVLMSNNLCKGNTADFVPSTSLQQSTLTYGPHVGFDSGSQILLGGQGRHTFRFYLTDAAAGAGVTQLNDGLSNVVPRGAIMPRDGYLLGIYVKSNAAVTAGSITFFPRINNANIGSGCAIVGGTYNSREEGFRAAPFLAGDILTCVYSSTGGLLPAGTDDFDVSVVVVY